MDPDNENNPPNPNPPPEPETQNNLDLIDEAELFALTLEDVDPTLANLACLLHVTIFVATFFIIVNNNYILPYVIVWLLFLSLLKVYEINAEL